MELALYDRIGRGYSTTRETDSRLARLIWEGLGDAKTVLNVGAGTGAYEPPDRTVLAVEPSTVMLGQRPANTAPAAASSAESLPFTDNSFDAVMTVHSDHHWCADARGCGRCDEWRAVESCSLTPTRPRLSGSGSPPNTSQRSLT